MNTPITLFGYATSPFVRKVSCYLYYKDLSFDFVAVSPVEPKKTIGFTGDSQVPVLQIGDEWRLDSTPIGMWIDQLFPEKPLMGRNATEKDAILAIDQWASEQFIPGIFFRSAVDAEMTDDYRRRAWRLAEIVSSGAKIPDPIRQAWPELLRSAPFIKMIVDQLDRTEPLETMQQRLMVELADHLGDGPFLGGMETPSLADFAVYPQLMFPYQVGLTDEMAVAQYSVLDQWLKRVSETLPQNPWCIDDSFIVNAWPV